MSTYMVDDRNGEVRSSPIMDDYDYEEAAEEAHDNLVRSLIEAGGEIRHLRGLLARAYEQLLLLGYDSGFTNDEIHTLTTDIKKYLEETI